MNIGGLLRTSIIDFPDRLACVIFTVGCNFRCPYCHNPELAAEYSDLPDNSSNNLKEIFQFLEKRKSILEGIVITGGEPTLQPDLYNFIRLAAKIGYKIKLDTNGSRPAILSKLLKEQLIDYVAMDIKTSLDKYNAVMKKNQNKHEMLCNINKSIDLIMNMAPDYEFRTTCVRPLIDGITMEKIGIMLKGAKKYVLQQCVRNVKVLDQTFISHDSNFFTESEIFALGQLISGNVQSIELRNI